MKQVLTAKLKLAPTTELLNLLRDVLLASQTRRNYASWVVWLYISQMSHLIGEYVSLVKETVLLRYSFVFAPKLAAELTQKSSQAIHSTPGMRSVLRRSRKK